jgi:hypothetical protein
VALRLVERGGGEPTQGKEQEGGGWRGEEMDQSRYVHSVILPDHSMSVRRTVSLLLLLLIVPVVPPGSCWSMSRVGSDSQMRREEKRR